MLAKKTAPHTTGYEFISADEYEFTPNEPYEAPSWFLNGHGHTIIRNFTGSKNWPPHHRIEISTPDDDFLALDVSTTKRSHSTAPKANVLLLHGLEGDSHRYYISELAWQLYHQGYRVLGMNFRSCGGKMNKKRRFYHSGETSDPKFVLEWMRDQWPSEPRFAVGFSLGGNVLTKLAGELQSSPLIKAAIPVSAPFNLELGANVIDAGFNKLYQQQFILSLKNKLEQKRRRFPDLPQFRGNSFWEFDDQVTAPLHGFSGAADYYHRSSAAQYIPDIQIPTLIIHSKEDPICPFEGVPVDAISKNPWCSAIFTEQGGHVAFGSQPHGWLNRTIRNFIEHFALSNQSHE